MNLLLRVLAGLVAAALVTTACVADDQPDEIRSGIGGAATSINATSINANAVALAPGPDGGFYWAELSGAVRADDGSTLIRLDVSLEGQRGLLGLAVDAEGRVFAGYIGDDLRLTVAEVTDGSVRVVWLGPTTVQGGNGGRVKIAADGAILFGIGLLNDRAGQADPTSIVGKVVRIDPDGDADQTPEILSGPWNNPFALAIDGDGRLWVADNHPQDGQERLSRADAGFGPTSAAVLPPDSAPTGMSAVGNELWVCTYNTRQLLRYRPLGNQQVLQGSAVDDCLLDVATLSDGSVIYSTGETIERLDPTTIE